ncbi:hypothetical protein [Capnocytophaga canimorsus]|uniref:hypothetical protein n=1 Tax=Capnocytophaga canimorsus TaxID=28188 RepID=UPI0026790933
MEATIKDTKLLQIKDIQEILDCTRHTAMRLRIEIAQHFSLEKSNHVTYRHLRKYLNL